MASQVASLEVVAGREALAARARDLFVEHASGAVALAGGETPRRAYELIASSDVSWDDVEVYLTDERCVPLDHQMSNHRIISETLLSKVGVRSHPVSVDLDPAAAAAAYEEEVAAALPFSFVFLGLGADGHTASLFPSDPSHTRRDVLVMPAPAPDTGMWRVTLTLAALDQAERAVFLVGGEDKGEALSRLLRGDPIPASLVRPRIGVTILADEEAARAADAV